LHRQLCGFDISESALRLSALSLYLTAIELDPQPIPPEKLTFNALDGVVLFNHRRDEDHQLGPVIGSLGDHIGDQFDGRFDLVLCNPPWTRIKNEELASQLDTFSKEVVSRKDEALGKAYQNPRGEPDLPFLWKATDWCRPNGRIAMVLPARTLFRQGDVASQSRSALFRLMRFTGIVNCSNIRKTNVWPEMDQPFMLVFVQNEIPERHCEFWFVCPQADYSRNRIGEFRIDAHATHVVEVADVLKEGWILKTLAVGTGLDVGVVQNIHRRSHVSLKKYWRERLKLTSRKGYVVLGNGPTADASQMLTLPDLSNPISHEGRFTVIPYAYAPFKYHRLNRTRIMKKDDPLRVYRGPLLLLKQSLPTDRKKGNSLTSHIDIAFNQSFYGYSAHGHPQADLLVQYLHLFAHSNLWSYFILCTSPKLGTERPVFLKSDFDSCPIVPLEDLTDEHRVQIGELARRLESEDESVFDEIDDLFGRLYGLSKRDIQVMTDTLTVRNPHDELGTRASTPPTPAEAELFRGVLQTALGPFAKKLDKLLVVEPLGISDQGISFRFVSVRVTDQEFELSDRLQGLILKLAERTGASIIIQPDVDALLIGILNQYRYWNQSRARLLAADILRDYFSTFEGRK
jgi:hypothetical protein